MYTFYNITNNDFDDSLIGEAQLSMRVTETIDGNVSFLYSNIGSEDISVARIYFEDTVPRMTFIDFGSFSDGVNFSNVKVSPPDLPGGTAFLFESDYSYGAPSPSKSGINPGQHLEILFAYAGSEDFNSIIKALNYPDTSGMRVGLHAIGFESEGSEAFINTPIPEPGTMLLLGAGLFGLAFFSRKKFMKK